MLAVNPKRGVVAKKTASLASMGGKARARKLTAEQRIEIARAGALTRWTGPRLFAEYGDDTRPLRIGPIEIPCYVLSDGRRVLSQRGLQGGIGLSRSAGKSGARRIAQLLAALDAKGFDTSELIARVNQVTGYISNLELKVEQEKALADRLKQERDEAAERATVLELLCVHEKARADHFEQELATQRQYVQLAHGSPRHTLVRARIAAEQRAEAAEARLSALLSEVPAWERALEILPLNDSQRFATTQIIADVKRICGLDALQTGAETR